jgi:hypothetical protein
MKEFIREVFNKNRRCPSDACLTAFNIHFGDAINVEWFDKGKSYEAIFYKNDIEYIALFDLSGSLLEYRQNLTFDYMPEKIRSIVDSKGELMNFVLRNKRNHIDYEIIYRDMDLNRFMLIITDSGKIFQEKKL